MAGPLTGWTVVVTRAEGPGGPLGSALASDGAQVLHLPTVSIGPPDDPMPLRRGLERLASYDWLVLTSPRAATAVVEGLAGLVGSSRDPRESPAWPGVAVVGERTGEWARELGLSVDVVGTGEGGEELARDLVRRGIGESARVFFPASSRAGRGLVTILDAAGATVDRVEAYVTRVTPFDVPASGDVRDADVVTFTSPSAVEGWVLGWEGEGGDPRRATRFHVVIGATTGAALEAHGLEAVMAPEPSFEGVVHAVRQVAANEQRSRG